MELQGVFVWMGEGLHVEWAFLYLLSNFFASILLKFLGDIWLARLYSVKDFFLFILCEIMYAVREL